MKEIERTLKHEGGYVNDLDDAGGETKCGISKRQYPNEDIANLTLERAIEIYKRDYWDRLALDHISNTRLRWKVFDIAVNMGIGVAARFLQRAVGVKDDGIIGAQTLAAANNTDVQRTIFRLAELQTRRYVDIVLTRPANLKFLKGWINRAFDLAEDLA